MRARVFATVSGQNTAVLLRGPDADGGIDVGSSDSMDGVLEFTSGEPFEECIFLVRSGGRVAYVKS